MFWLSLVLVSTLSAQNPPNSDAVKRGKDIFERTCVSGPCHGIGGEPGRAPRLKGRAFTAESLTRVLHQGVANTNMSSWREKLSEADLSNVMAYIASLEQATAGQAPAGAFTGPEQAKRGYEIFFQANAAAACGTCHAMGGRGTSIAPDLSRWARLAPRAIAIGIRATQTEYTQTIKLKKGSAFPGLKLGQDEATIQYYDLSVTPPSLRKLEKSEIESATENTAWKHPPGVADYSNEQVADIIAFIRWSAYRDTKGVKPEEVE